VTVTPAPANLLTCSTTPFTATVTGTTNISVSWSVTPASGAGTIDTAGNYSSPDVAPIAPANTATVTATSVASPSLSDSAPPFVLATAFPGAAVPVAGSTGIGETGNPAIGIYQHLAAASGSRVYTTWVENPDAATEIKLMVARSDDGGKTWGPGVAAIDANILGGYTTDNGSIDCPAIAVDAGNPDVIYATATVDVTNSLSAAVGDPADPAVVLTVSTDGGKTFTPTVLSTAFATLYPCQDVASPAANTVVVVAPGDGCGEGHSDMFVWSDANRGAGFTQGALDANNTWWANGLTGSLSILRGDARCADDLIEYDNGGDLSSGQAIESARMFVDGSGRLCLGYAATAEMGAIENSYVQCSTDAGQTFSTPVEIDPALATDNQPSGALGPGNAAAMAWTTTLVNASQTNLYIAVSGDKGATFGAPILVPTVDTPFSPSILFDTSGVLWIAYVIEDGGEYSVFVDKTCDGGTTFSGPVQVNAAATFSLLVPTLLDAGAPAPLVMGAEEASLAAFSLSP
jgi:hypothetical protein